MTNNTKVGQLKTWISRDLTLDPGNQLEKAHNLDELESRLTEIVRYLIDHDFNRLLNILYRIDVAEEKVKFALSDENKEDIASTLAGLILQRQQEKIEIRAKYSPKR